MIDPSSLEPFLAALASANPTPGGGAASAVAGALGCAQAQMVAALTAQNPRYLSLKDAMQQSWETLEGYRAQFLRLASQDAQGYERVAQALKLPKSSKSEQQAREQELAQALKAACQAPFLMLEVVGKALDELDWLARKGSALAKSDIMCAAAFFTAAAAGASATVLANTSWMKDRKLARQLEALEAHERELARLHGQEIIARVERELLA